jgi:hypothetical protein
VSEFVLRNCTHILTSSFKFSPVKPYYLSGFPFSEHLKSDFKPSKDEFFPKGFSQNPELHKMNKLNHLLPSINDFISLFQLDLSIKLQVLPSHKHELFLPPLPLLSLLSLLIRNALLELFKGLVLGVMDPIVSLHSLKDLVILHPFLYVLRLSF